MPTNQSYFCSAQQRHIAPEDVRGCGHYYHPNGCTHTSNTNTCKVIGAQVRAQSTPKYRKPAQEFQAGVLRESGGCLHTPHADF